MSRWEATFTDPGGESNPVVVDLNGGAFSWPVNDTGTANVECRTRDLKDAGLLPARDNLAGKWFAWDGPPGRWAGVVAAVRSHGTGTTEVVARSFDALLQARRTPKVADTGMANVGAVLRRNVEDRHRASDPLRLEIATDGHGPAVPAIQRANDLHDLLAGLARSSGWEWRVDHDARTLEFRERVGRDRSGSVVLTEGAAVRGFDLAFDLEALRNELLAVPADEPFARTRTVAVRDDHSVNRHGLRQASEVFPGLVTRAGLRAVADARLGQLVGQGDTLGLTLGNDGGVNGPAEGPGSALLWSAFREGDSVLAVLPSANARVRARVMVRAYDLEADELDLSCDVEEWL
jgi:hypothetical protein